jgi:hypothetical protein
MLCKRCEGQGRTNGTRRRSDEACRMLTCERCGAAILMLAGVVVGVGDATLAGLARFGLADTGRPLLEPGREGRDRCAAS